MVGCEIFFVNFNSDFRAEAPFHMHCIGHSLGKNKDNNNLKFIGHIATYEINNTLIDCSNNEIEQFHIKWIN